MGLIAEHDEDVDKGTDTSFQKHCHSVTVSNYLVFTLRKFIFKKSLGK